ncbi:MAG: DUF2975 domain-containing protein [Pedobacter sp.]|nr:DUF2975 domain-containing protein [Pedobacter sp.]MDQ8051401.1 DUF2975 domain-containing protein [Pedobacter sp.]
MKTSQKTITLIAVIAIIALLILKIFPLHYYPEMDYYEGSYFYKESKIDSLNHAIRQAEAKNAGLKYEKEGYINEGYHYSGLTSYIGIGNLTTDRKNKGAFLSFRDIGLKIYEQVSRSYLVFHTTNGQGYLSIMQFKKGKEGTQVSIVDQKVGYSYNPSNNSILIPLHAKWVEMLGYVVVYGLMLLFIAIFLFALTTFFKFLLAISKNQAFTCANTLRLKDIAVAMLILAFFPLAINLIAYLVIVSIYPAEGLAFNYSFWKLEVYYLIAAILSYVMYTAFKHAMLLQEENEFTI